MLSVFTNVDILFTGIDNNTFTVYMGIDISAFLLWKFVHQPPIWFPVSCQLNYSMFWVPSSQSSGNRPMRKSVGISTISCLQVNVRCSSDFAAAILDLLLPVISDSTGSMSCESSDLGNGMVAFEISTKHSLQVNIRCTFGLAAAILDFPLKVCFDIIGSTENMSNELSDQGIVGVTDWISRIHSLQVNKQCTTLNYHAVNLKPKQVVILLVAFQFYYCGLPYRLKQRVND